MRKSKGFTLIELMIVVAIIGILSAIAIPKFADLIRKSNEGATKGNLGALRGALAIYYGESEGVYPAVTASGPQATAGTLGAVLTADGGKYIKEVPSCYAPGPSYGHAKSGDINIGVALGDDAGEWGYELNVTTTSGHTQGDIWVSCTHTDTKSTVWNVY
jgi:prepilin-type N-terminal cleavage/methylation domain-containing protein